MKFIGKGNETFLFLNGIKPINEIFLGDGITWQPCDCNPTPDEIVSKAKSEADIGVACLFLRSISSQFHITANDSKTLAARAWNSSWDALLLGALHDCEVGFNFQSDVPAEKFKDAKDFHVTNYHLRGLISKKSKIISAAEQKWIERYYSGAKKLFDNEKYMNAVHCLASYRWHSMPRAQLALLWAGIEGIFDADSELSFRLSVYISEFLSPRNKKRRKTIFSNVRKLYTLRSKAVHGGILKNPSKAVSESFMFLREIIKKSAEKEAMPDPKELVP